MTALAIDIGGTFTDAVAIDDRGDLYRAKTLTTPGDPVDGSIASVRRVLAESGIDPASITRVVHGTTLATNVILERRGAATAFITTAGFRTLLALGHYARVEDERYDLQYHPPEPPVPLSHCFEVPERISARGEILIPLTDGAVEAVITRIAALEVASVAICLLHSYANPAHEERVAARCAEALPGVMVVPSSATWPEMREYERACTTVVSACVGPVMASYLDAVDERLGHLGIPARVQIMESSGGVMSAGHAAARAVYTIESGPAAGVLAAGHVGDATGHRDLISFDMGGTTAKAGVIRDGAPQITHDFHVGGKGSFGGRRGGSGIPIRVPAIDLAEVGAGGGSIAWIDDGGALRLGPQSAGASPGPACYGLGGKDATITDADLVLGYLDPRSFAGGTMTLRHALAEKAIVGNVAARLRLDIPAAAHVIYEIANSNMAAAVDVVTIQRGIDPSRYTLVASGGAGPMHVVRVAERFGIETVLIPVASGLASAVGLLATDLTLERARTFVVATDAADPATLEGVLDGLASSAASELGVALDQDNVRVARSVDMRYLGQAHEISVIAPLKMAATEDLETLTRSFLADYERAYGVQFDGPTEVVSLRVRVTHRVPRSNPRPAARQPETGDAVPTTERAAYFAEHGGFVDVPVYSRDRCGVGQRLRGPAIVEEPEATLVVPPSWEGAVEPSGHLLLRRR